MAGTTEEDAAFVLEEEAPLAGSGVASSDGRHFWCDEPESSGDDAVDQRRRENEMTEKLRLAVKPCDVVRRVTK